MRIFSYVIDHDLGFAPNPFHGVCSLAACKPDIRKHTNIGDMIVGTGSKPNGIAGKVSYWMRVDEIVGFDDYWSDPRFLRKRPTMNGSLVQRYGDNIYKREASADAFSQMDSFHSNTDGSLNYANWKRDTGSTDRVLLSHNFAYWGAGGPAVPDDFSDFVHTTQGHKCRFPADRIAAFSAWLLSLPDRGCLGDPANWPAKG